MTGWITSNDHKFVIGMGDHVKKGTGNGFIEFLKNNDWWQKNFYPTIADGDNEFYGKNQADWGAGKELFGLTDIKDRINVRFAENGVEYRTMINQSGINIHFISLHYPDKPNIDSISFRESSKEYMIRVLNSIKKMDNDIIIVGAHSRLGYWLDRLNPEQMRIVNEKADLVLSATTHVFHIFSEQGSDGPLALNTGSITRPRLWSSPGFVSVEVYDKPLRIDVSYIDCSKEKPSKPLMFSRALKYINGRISLN
jgi:predicted phosphodiesterase